MNATSSRVDLNLFRVFDAVYRAGSLTQAAAQLHLTQPAISNALARLRRQFGDPLFVRDGRRVAPTPRARAVAPDIAAALQALQRSLAVPQRFDAAASTRRFVLGMRDVLEFALMPTLTRQLLEQGPQLQLQSARIERRRLDRELVAGALDLAVDVPMTVGDELVREPLFREGLCVAMRPDHPLAGAPLRVESWLAARHITVSSRRTGPVLEDAVLQGEGLRRDVAVRCQHYYGACHLAASSDLLLVLPRYYGEWFKTQLPLRLAPPPVALPELEVMMYWPRNAEHDPAHGWLREQLRRAVRDGAPRPG
ncbi:LysR family transcriptional regulator [Solimonas marina]|uniref:LysR family transcriptional regulator n=1 Tax=Solimonas marina TaxID=2714601 RepID=A0A969WBJ6_9GAMM|nr:LysR family transcriptional regulator [Solimonas marina]NKF23937.1 LysR family transcriptional regulator [Solimonas marina]